MTDPNAQTPAAAHAAGAPLSHERGHAVGLVRPPRRRPRLLPSLIIWLVFKDRGSFTNIEAKEALNFQITIAIG